MVTIEHVNFILAVGGFIIWSLVLVDAFHGQFLMQDARQRATLGTSIIWLITLVYVITSASPLGWVPREFAVYIVAAARAVVLIIGIAVLREHRNGSNRSSEGSSPSRG